MRIVEIRNLDDCFDQGIMKEILFDQEVDSDFIEFLGNQGDLSYYPDFGRPYYRMDSPNGYIIKGVEGNNHSRVILSRDHPTDNIESIIELIKHYDQIC